MGRHNIKVDHFDALDEQGRMGTARGVMCGGVRGHHRHHHLTTIDYTANIATRRRCHQPPPAELSVPSPPRAAPECAMSEARPREAVADRGRQTGNQWTVPQVFYQPLRVGIGA